MMKREHMLSLEPPTTIAELRQRVQDVWGNLSQVDIRHARYTPALLAEGVHCELICLDTPYCDMCV